MAAQKATRMRAEGFSSAWLMCNRGRLNAGIPRQARNP